MLRLLSIALPFPYGTICSVIEQERETKVKARGFRMTPAELLAFTRNNPEPRDK